ncbi:MAG: hypothetical protein FH758_14955 [Firmicutes bacterium]|nr:hypothetical protein [Bacillota bacterium]
MSLKRKEHFVQSKRLHRNDVTVKGELVEHETSEELSAREMAPSTEQLQNNPMKTPPNNLTTKDKYRSKG